MVSKTNSRAASWWQKWERAGRDALGCAERPACFDRDKHSTVNCLPCRSSWASEAQCARAQSNSAVCGGVTLFSPWHHHLCWPLASQPPWIQLLLSQPLCRLETFRTSLLSTIWEWVCTKFSGCETHRDDYPALLREADGLHWVWLVGCCSHPFLPTPGEGPEEGLLSKPGCWGTALLWDTDTLVKSGDRWLCARAQSLHFAP